MICKTVIDVECEESVTIYARERTQLVEDIEKLVNRTKNIVIGYFENKIFTLSPDKIYCFFVENNKIYADTDNQRFMIKERLYTVENTVGDSFIKINQSCIVNIDKIERFEASFSGALTVVLKNGYKDYISRRQLKIVKERIGFKL